MHIAVFLWVCKWLCVCVCMCVTKKKTMKMKISERWVVKMQMQMQIQMKMKDSITWYKKKVGSFFLSEPHWQQTSLLSVLWRFSLYLNLNFGQNKFLCIFLLRFLKFELLWLPFFVFVKIGKKNHRNLICKFNRNVLKVSFFFVGFFLRKRKICTQKQVHVTKRGEKERKGQKRK